jgi:hypothetical protein
LSSTAVELNSIRRKAVAQSSVLRCRDFELEITHG